MKNLKYVLQLVIIVIVLLLLRKCGGNGPAKEKITIVRDTVRVVYHDTINSKPRLVRTIRGGKSKTYEQAALVCDSLNRLDTIYLQVAAPALAAVYDDTLRVKDLGYVSVRDTVAGNTITGRSYNYKLTCNNIRETVTIKKNTRQLFIGAGISVNEAAPAYLVQGGILYKTKKNSLFGIHAGLNEDGAIYYGASAYIGLTR